MTFNTLGFKAFKNLFKDLLDNETLSLRFRTEIGGFLEDFKTLSERINSTEMTIASMCEQNNNFKILCSIPGFGLITASALNASIDKAQAFSSPRALAVWLGLTPRQWASGDKSRLGGISKRGDRYLRKQIIHGARAALRWAKKRDDDYSRWINQLVLRVGINKAAVAVAHKMVRLAWILLQRQTEFKITTP